MKKSQVFKPKKGSGTSAFKKKSPYLTLEWVEYRNLFLSHNPLCYCCGKRATVVDHAIPHKGDRKLFIEVSNNFLPLCKVCHDTITANFDRYNPPKTEEKLKWIAQQRAINEITIRVKVISPKISREKTYDEDI